VSPRSLVVAPLSSPPYATILPILRARTVHRSSLGRSESSCLSNCALRYLETGQVIMQRIQRMQ